jgi:hypothetical protein
MASTAAFYELPVIFGMPDEYVVHISPLPSFVKFNFPRYDFMPNNINDLGSHKIEGQLWNKYTFVSFKFYLEVTNKPP